MEPSGWEGAAGTLIIWHHLPPPPTRSSHIVPTEGPKSTKGFCPNISATPEHLLVARGKHVLTRDTSAVPTLTQPHTSRHHPWGWGAAKHPGSPPTKASNQSSLINPVDLISRNRWERGTLGNHGLNSEGGTVSKPTGPISQRVHIMGGGGGEVQEAMKPYWKLKET